MGIKKNNILIIILVITCIIQSLTLLYFYNDNNKLIEQPIKQITNNYEVTGYSTDFTRISNELDNYIVNIKSNDTESKSKTGIIYYYKDNKATIITSHSNSDTYTITFPNGKQYTESPINIDNSNIIDIFIINIDFKVTPILKGNSNLLKPGEFILSRNQTTNIGYQDDTLVSNIRNNNIYDENNAYATITNNFYNTLIGSPIVNQNNEMIGMNIDANNTFILNNYIDIYVNNILNNNNNISNFNIGIKPINISDIQTYQKNNLNIDLSLINGIYISEIYEDSLYSDKLKINDIIIKINDIDIIDIYDYQDILLNTTSNDILKIELIRNNKVEIIEIIIP